MSPFADLSLEELVKMEVTSVSRKTAPLGYCSRGNRAEP